MAGVTVPGYPWAPPPPLAPPRRQRRWWLIAVVLAWALILGALGLWSVRHDPPTVPEQRSIAQALPVLQQATGAMLVAAAGPGRAVVLGETRVEHGCRITPVRAGVEATRDVTVYVPAERAGSVLEAIAGGLPAAYRARVSRSGTSSRVGLHADAGSYVAIDADTLADAQVLTLQAATGCRPPAVETPAVSDPQAGDPPMAFTAAVHALGASGEPTVTAVRCPGGGTAGTYTVDGVPRTGDLGRRLEPVLHGATVVRADPDGWAYRTGADSVVVTANGTAWRLSATTACR